MIPDRPKPIQWRYGKRQMPDLESLAMPEDEPDQPKDEPDQPKDEPDQPKDEPDLPEDEPDQPDTQSLLDRVRAGDPEALNLLYARYGKRILAYVCSELGGHEIRGISAEDLKQQVMLRSLDKVKDIKSVPHLRWLFSRLAKQVVIDEWRKETADKRDRRKKVYLDDEDGPDPVAIDARPSGRVQEAEVHRIYLDCLQTLSEDHRRVLQLRHLIALPFKDVAAEMQRSEEAAAMLLGRAEKQLRDCMRGKGVDC